MQVHIAQRHLIPKLLTEHGLTGDQLAFPQPVLEAAAAGWTREAGVRQLSQALAAVCRHVAVDVVSAAEAGDGAADPAALAEGAASGDEGLGSDSRDRSELVSSSVEARPGHALAAPAQGALPGFWALPRPWRRKPARPHRLRPGAGSAQPLAAADPELHTSQPPSAADTLRRLLIDKVSSCDASSSLWHASR